MSLRPDFSVDHQNVDQFCKGFSQAANKVTLKSRKTKISLLHEQSLNIYLYNYLWWLARILQDLLPKLIEFRRLSDLRRKSPEYEKIGFFYTVFWEGELVWVRFNQSACEERKNEYLSNTRNKLITSEIKPDNSAIKHPILNLITD